MTKLFCYQYHTQRGAGYAALLVLFLPVLWPALFSPLGHASASLFSEWNAPKPRHLSLLKGALHREISNEMKSELWAPLPHGWKPCIPSASITGHPVRSSGYIQVFLDGGLNQQRMGVCDAVAVAKILNATLVIPHLEVNPVWQDSSSFEEIYDVDHFINELKDEISIVRELPSEFAWSTREYYAVAIRATRIKTAPVHASTNWYLENVLPVLQSYGIAAIAPFSHRLAFDNLPAALQQLRCKVNFQALIFVPHINALGEMLVKRLRYPASMRSDEFMQEFIDENVSKGSGKYAALHLRFDKVGHRTYENLKTIRPNMALVGQLFLNKSLEWSEFQWEVQTGHKDREGHIRLRKPKQSIYTYPSPDCMCQD